MRFQTFRLQSTFAARGEVTMLCFEVSHESGVRNTLCIKR